MGLRLLCVIAHPDDECFAFGGALAIAAEQGVEIYVICMTDGQAASYRGTATTAAELGQMRRAEFAASCDVLGVTRHEVWDYQDGQMEFQNFSEVAGRLVKIMRDYKPQVVLTFSPDGAVNTHADHTTVSAITSAAYHWASWPKRYPELGPIHHAERLYLLSTSFFLEGRPSPMPAPWTVTLDVRHVMEKRHQAFRRHVTQAPLMEQTAATFKEFGTTEHYLLTATREPREALQQTSFFDGLQENE